MGFGNSQSNSGGIQSGGINSGGIQSGGIQSRNPQQPIQQPVQTGNTGLNMQKNVGQPQQQGGIGGLNLVKGQKLNLSKTDPTLTNVKVGLGWDINAGVGEEYDLDVQAVLLDKNGQMKGSDDLIFFNNLRSKCGSIVHQGDNRTGAGEGDDEVIDISLQQVPADIEKIVFLTTIHDAQAKRQNFGQVSNAYIRLVNQVSNQPIAKFDLTEDYSTSISVIMGEIYRHNGEWRFAAKGEGRLEDLSGLIALYGLR